MAISTNGTVIARLAGALYNTQMSNATYEEVKTLDPSSLANTLYARDFASSTDESVATTLVTNLGLTAVEGLANWVAAQLTAAGSAKGAKVVELLNGFAQMSADATYGAAATAFNTKVDAALALSQTTGNAGGTFAAAGIVNGKVFTLTTGVDVALMAGTSGDDTYYAAADTFTSGDRLAGGNGSDVLNITLGAVNTSGTFGTGIETINVSNFHSASNTVDLTNWTGVTTVGNGASTEALVFSGLNESVATVNITDIATAKNTTLTYKDTQTLNATDSLTVNVANVTAAVTLTAATSTTGTGGIESFTVHSTGANSTGVITLAGTIQSSGLGATQKQTVAVTGDKNVKLAVSTDMTTVSASAFTGKLAVDLTGSANYTATGGTGNDTFTFGSAFNASDKVNGGDGTDKIQVSAAVDSTLAGYVNTKSATTGVYNVRNVEQLGYTGTAAWAVDASLISATNTGINSYSVDGAVTAASGSAAQVAAAAAGVAFSAIGDTQSFIFTNSVTGGLGGAASASTVAGAAGSAGVTFAPATDTATNVLNVELQGVTITGGRGGAAFSAGTVATATGAVAVDASSFEVINITSSKAATGSATNALTGGAAGATGGTSAAGSAGAELVVSANTTINLTGNNEISLGSISNSNTPVAIKAAALTGKLTVTTGTAADTIEVGSGGSALTLAGGVDRINLVAGTAKTDTVTITAATNTTSTAFVKISGFTNSTTSTVADKLDLVGTNTAVAGTGAIVDLGAVVAGLTGSLNASGVITFGGSGLANATLANLITAAYGASFINAVDDKVVAFEYGGNTYIAKGESTGAGFDAGTDQIVELTGLVGVTALSTASAATTVFIA